MGRSSATTDDRGQYRIFNLAPGRYYVQASLSQLFLENGTRKYEPILYPGVSPVKDARSVELVRGGEVRGIDFHMRSAPTYTVSGQVLDENGQPASGGSVSAMYADSGYMDKRPAGADAPLVDGRFRLRGLLPGHYQLTVTLPTRAIRGERLYAKAFDVEAGDVNGLLVHLGRGPVLRGRPVADDGTTPGSVAGLHVIPSLPSEKTILSGSRTEGVVSADGTFEIRNLPPGQYTLRLVRLPPPVTVAGPPFYIREIRWNGQDVADQGVTIAEGATTEITIVLDYTGGTVSGKLVGERGEPAGAPVVMLSADAAKRDSDRYFRLTTTDQNGDFAFPGVIPGDYLIVPYPVTEAARAQDPEISERLLPYATRISVRKNGTTNQDLRMTLEIRKALEGLLR